MTSPYDEKIGKLNTALENVYLKKVNIIDELGTLLDEMIAIEPIIFRIDVSSTNADFYHIDGIDSNISINKMGDYLVFKLELTDIENAVLILGKFMQWIKYYSLDDLVDSDDDGVIIASVSDLTEVTS